MTATCGDHLLTYDVHLHLRAARQRLWLAFILRNYRQRERRERLIVQLTRNQQRRIKRIRELQQSRVGVTVGLEHRIVDGGERTGRVSVSGENVAGNDRTDGSSFADVHHVRLLAGLEFGRMIVGVGHYDAHGNSARLARRSGVGRSAAHVQQQTLLALNAFLVERPNEN